MSKKTKQKNRNYLSAQDSPVKRKTGTRTERIVDEKVFELIYNYDEVNSKKGFKYGLISGIEELKYFEIDNPNVKVDKNNCNLLLYWTGYFDTQFVYDPCNKISIVVLKQLQDNEYDELFLKELIEVVYNNL